MSWKNETYCCRINFAQSVHNETIQTINLFILTKGDKKIVVNIKSLPVGIYTLAIKGKTEKIIKL